MLVAAAPKGAVGTRVGLLAAAAAGLWLGPSACFTLLSSRAPPATPAGTRTPTHTQTHTGRDCRGWSATEAGARSDSQLLALSPAVLQDMAVAAADAVAAAYLADAADAGPGMVGAGAALPLALPPVAMSGAGAAPVASLPSATERAEQGAVLTQQARERQRQPQQQQPGQPVAAGGGLAATIGRVTDALAGAARGARGPRRASSSSGAGSAKAGPSGGGSGGGSEGGGSALEAGWWPTYVHAQLNSTRQLQRFVNAVALNRWVQVRLAASC